MTYIKKTSLFMVTTIILVLIAAFFIGSTVASQSRVSEQAQYKFRKTQEKAYVDQLRTYLSEKGYHNSGITLTSVTYEDGSRTYKATIHHAGIDRLTQTQRRELKLQLSELPTTVPDTIYHEFLTLNY